jgi:superfamily I DNA/RNA helicase
MKLNEEQQVIQDSFILGNSLLINAVAGSGKSTLLRSLCHTDYAKNKKILLVAFNKHIADEMSGTVPKNVRVTTAHALGLSLYKNLEGNFLLSNRATRSLFTQLHLHNVSYGDFEQLWQIARLLCPSWLPKEKWQSATQELLNDWSTENTNIPWFNKAVSLYEKIHKRDHSIDFTDMLWLPATYSKFSPLDYDCILVDELQDLNNAQISLLRRISTPKTQFVGVGDPLQAIFGFAGAGNDNFPLVRRLFNIKNTYTSSICYRCPPNHIDFVSKWNPQIKAHKQEDGTFANLEELVLESVPMGALVLAKKYELLIPLVLEALKTDIAIKLNGVSCFSGILESIQTHGYALGLDKQIEQVEQQIKKLPRLPSTKDRLRELGFKLDVLSEFTSLNMGKDAIIKFLSRIKTPKAIPHILLSTVHRAKGLEAENVSVMIDDSFHDKEIELETLKVNYVASTRSLDSLHFVATKS